MISPETEHLMNRAEEEAILAIRAKHPAAARAHQGLALRYSTKAVEGLLEEENRDQSQDSQLQGHNS